ncbi:hypothetical protein HZC34_05240 [Candidatus Saganbacteria bacterium]|nr:hypothetical protein [Candidatus Saganbacteria bacterium]
MKRILALLVMVMFFGNAFIIAAEAKHKKFKGKLHLKKHYRLKIHKK